MDGSSGTGTVVPDHGSDSVAGVAAVASVGHPGKTFTTANWLAWDHLGTARCAQTCTDHMRVHAQSIRIPCLTCRDV